MTTGEHSGRGHHHDDPYLESRAARSPGNRQVPPAGSTPRRAADPPRRPPDPPGHPATQPGRPAGPPGRPPWSPRAGAPAGPPPSDSRAAGDYWAAGDSREASDFWAAGDRGGYQPPPRRPTGQARSPRHSADSDAQAPFRAPTPPPGTPARPAGPRAAGYPTGGYPTGGYPTGGRPGAGHPAAETGRAAPTGRPANGSPPYHPSGSHTGSLPRAIGPGPNQPARGGPGRPGPAGPTTGALAPVNGRPEHQYPTQRATSPAAAGYPPEAARRSPAGTGARSPQRSAEPEPGQEPEPKAGRRRLPLWQELPLLLVIAFCLAILIRTFLLQAFFIPSGSMEDTLIAGDRVLVNKVVYNLREPTRGEVVVFKGTEAWAPLVADEETSLFARIGRTFGDLVGVSQPGEKDFIKRVIGVPGDVVSCCDPEGRVLVNGEPINEAYVIRDSPLIEAEDGVRDCRAREFDDVVVEPGNLFVLGDHRQRSQDSRCQGQIPIDNVIGRAFIIVWPSDRWAGLSATDAFAGVPPPAVASGVPTVSSDSGGVHLSAQLSVLVPLLFPLAFAHAAGSSGNHPASFGSSGRFRRPGHGPSRRLAP